MCGYSGALTLRQKTRQSQVTQNTEKCGIFLNLTPICHDKGLYRYRRLLGSPHGKHNEVPICVLYLQSNSAIHKVKDMPELDEPAPDFTIDSTRGKISLSDFRGKWVVLFAYPADFTPICEMDISSFAEEQNRDSMTWAFSSSDEALTPRSLTESGLEKLKRQLE